MQERISTQAWKNRYRVGPRIGRGGFKDVYRAIEVSSGDPVAFAHLREVEPQDLEREVSLARRVESEHVAGIRDHHVDHEREEAYLVAELCEGPTLAELVDQGPLTLARGAPIMVAFARGLEAIHRAHVLHRDIKLENVILAPRGTKLTLNILDFGLAHRARDENTHAGVLPLAGSLGYLAAEAVRGEAVDARTDVYALGVCYFRMLAGSFPLELGGGSPLAQLEKIARMQRHDLSALAGQPPALVQLVGRMLAPTPGERPYMPEVVRVLEGALGAAQPIVLGPDAPAGEARAAGARSSASASARAAPLWTTEWTASLPGLDVDRVLPAPCGWAPIVVWSPGPTTTVRALTAQGALRWSTRLDAHVRAGLRADLDGDGVRELYFVSEDKLISLDVRGALRFERILPTRLVAGTPSMMAILGRRQCHLVIDGEIYDAHGAPALRLPHQVQGDGQRLVRADSGRGLSYNGLAEQAFRGDGGTPAAIVHTPGAREFHVAHLEAARGAPRVWLSVYGPGGARVHRWPIAEATVATGALDQVVRLIDHQQPSFGVRHAPLAALSPTGQAALIVPFLHQPGPWPSVIASFALPGGTEAWREPFGCGSALLGDVDGDGQAELVAGDGQALVAWSPWTGERRAEQAARGRPAALGDPFGQGRRCLITVTDDGLEVLRGAECLPGQMVWVGPRGDQWLSGALGARGRTLGPV
jgi:hypothetical protein